MSETINVYEVVKKLIGPINPVGETNTDDARFENLVTIITLAELLFRDINALRHYEKRGEFSLKRAGVRAGAFIDEMVEEYDHDET